MKNRLFVGILVGSLLLVACGKEEEITKQPDLVEPPVEEISSPIVPTTVDVVAPAIPMEEAKLIAETDCIKSGETIEAGYYNANSQTWWFDANLSEVKEGCNPACVVSVNRTVEINWRCTGLAKEEGEV